MCIASEPVLQNLCTISQKITAGEIAASLDIVRSSGFNIEQEQVWYALGSEVVILSSKFLEGF
jgi:hypothetical protein